VSEIKINIGCGPNGQLDGYDNLDNSPSALVEKIPLVKKLLYKIGTINEQQYKANWKGVIYCDASKALPYKSESVDKIYTSHFLEHIPHEHGMRILKGCYRVLKKSGTMRIVVPDLLFHAESYVNNTRKLLMGNGLPTDSKSHDCFLKSMYGAYLDNKRFGAEHCYMYDLPSLASALQQAGFKQIEPRGYREGIDAELAAHDSRPEDSLHVEVWK